MTPKQTLRHSGLVALGGVARLVHGRPPVLRELRQFVLLQYASALGSVVHATPLISALRTALPDAEIVVCASGFASEIYRDNPGVTRVCETPDPLRHFRPAVRAIRRVLPRGPFATLTSVANERSTIGLAAVLAGAQNLVGFTLVPELYREALKLDRSLSLIANNLRIVSALGHETKHHEPQMFFGLEDLDYARTLLRRFKEPRRATAVLVTQTSVTQKKSWRGERFAAVAKVLRERHGMNVVLVGASSERDAIARLAEQIGDSAQSVAGETTLPQLAALLSLCRVGVSLDTGTLHVARAVGLPVVIVAPAWSPPVEWLPVGNERFVILKHRDMALDAIPSDYVIDEVDVADVLAGLERLLALEAR